MTTKLRPGFQFKVFIQLIRAVFPRWNFFDQVAYNFEIEFRVSNGANWSRVQFHETRKPFSLFINPKMNMALAEANIIEHFAKDIQELQSLNPLVHSKDVHKLTSYKLLKSVLEVKLQEYELPTSSLQFKVIAKSANDTVDIYVSDWISAEIL